MTKALAEVRRATLYPIIGVVVLVAAMAAAWLILGPRVASAFWQKGVFSDGSSPALITLRASSLQEKVYALHIRGEASLDGEAQVALLLGERPVEVVQLEDDGQFEWIVDWYSTEAVLRYEPKTTKSGEVRLRYRFFAL